MRKIVYDYHFKAINLTDYELTIEFTLQGKLAKYARTGMIKAIKSKTGKNVGRVDVWEEIPKNMHGFINLQINTFLKTIKADIEQDHIKILNHFVDTGEFKDDLKTIWLRLIVSGQYVDEAEN